jgi:hypothetical protein
MPPYSYTTSTRVSCLTVLKQKNEWVVFLFKTPVFLFKTPVKKQILSSQKIIQSVLQYVSPIPSYVSSKMSLLNTLRLWPSKVSPQMSSLNDHPTRCHDKLSTLLLYHPLPLHCPPPYNVYLCETTMAKHFVSLQKKKIKLTQTMPAHYFKTLSSNHFQTLSYRTVISR